jgi:hypothetical protein
VTRTGHRAAASSPSWCSERVSDHEEYGSTCGARTDVEDEGTCDDLFD